MADSEKRVEELFAGACPAVNRKPETTSTTSSKEIEEAAAIERRKTMDPKHLELFAAIDRGDLAALKKSVLEENVSVNISDEHDMSALLQAAYKGNLEMCQFLLSNGAKVNATCHKNFYTPLMMAALSGKKDVVKLLLDAGANINSLNSIGKTASDLAGFVGQHEVALLIKNYLTMDRLEPYFTPQGTNPARISEELAKALQAIVMATTYHPVKIVIAVNKNPELLSEASLKKSCSVLDDLCRKCVRAKNDFDEVLALKLHYVSGMLQLCREHMEKYPDKTDLSALLKSLLKENERGIKIGCEQVIRKVLTAFPYTELPLLQTLATTISPVKVGDDPTAFQCVQQVFSGMQSIRNVDTWCSACGQPSSELRCSACKQNRYCSQECQKLHWFVHKKTCKHKQQAKN